MTLSGRCSRLEFVGVLAAVLAAPALGQSAEELGDKLLDEANAVFQSKGLRLSSRCRGWLGNYVRAGAERLIAENAQEKLPQAQANIRKFAAKMIAERMDSTGGVIDDEAFQKARSSLCPLYPFC